MSPSSHPQPIHVRLMNEYGVDFPIWARRADDDYSIDDLLSADTAQQLRRWAADFDAHYSFETGWPDQESLRRHRATGQRLAERLRSELGPGFVVELDFWETLVEGARKRRFWRFRR